MLGLRELQAKLHEWRLANFPDADERQQREGMVEELGELFHAHLKERQGIRQGNEVNPELLQRDAIGDLLIYACGYCSFQGWDMREILERTAEHVMLRDWVKFPGNGFTE